MFVKVLGILDMVGAFIMAFYYFNVVSMNPVIGVMLYLFLKCVVFFGDFLSVLDGVAAIMILIDIFTQSGLLTYILVMYLLAKGVISMF
jgi:hypothetical protein